MTTQTNRQNVEHNRLIGQHANIVTEALSVNWTYDSLRSTAARAVAEGALVPGRIEDIPDFAREMVLEMVKTDNLLECLQSWVEVYLKWYITNGGATSR